MSQLRSKIDVRKVVMLWIRTRGFSSYCGNVVGRSISFQRNAVWHSPPSEIFSEEILFPPLQPLRRSARDSALPCPSFSRTSLGGFERYKNMVLIHKKYLILLQELPQAAIKDLIKTLNITKKMLVKINSLREQANLSAII